MKVIQNIRVKVGTYEKDGQTKNKYETVGRVLQKDDGGKMYLLNRTFNPAGAPNPDGRDSIIMNLWDVQENEGQAQQAPAPQETSYADDSEIPF